MITFKHLKHLLFSALIGILGFSMSVSAEFTAPAPTHLGGDGSVKFISQNSADTISAPDWVTITNRTDHDLGDDTYEITVRWTYEKNWVSDGETTPRTASIFAGGDSINVTQPGIDNTYVYDTPSGNLEGVVYSRAENTKFIYVYCRVPGSQVSGLAQGEHWANEGRFFDFYSFSDQWISFQDASLTVTSSQTSSPLEGRDYRARIRIAYGNNFLENAVTSERSASFKLGAPGTESQTYSLVQPGIDNTYIYEPPLDEIENFDIHYSNGLVLKESGYYRGLKTHAIR